MLNKAKAKLHKAIRPTYFTYNFERFGYRSYISIDIDNNSIYPIKNIQMTTNNETKQS
jgi:hypothetical protein